MTAPTQAQLEGGLELLLAAVHADDPKREILVRIGDLMRDFRALTAAAEVGDRHDGELYFSTAQVNWHLGRIAKTVAATIERCAQKCDDMARIAETEEGGEEMGARADAFAEAAAAIRALKEKP